MQTVTKMRVWAPDCGAEVFEPDAFATQVGKTIPVVDAVDGQATHGIVRSAEVSADGTVATLTVEVAHRGESMRGRKPFPMSAGFNAHG